ncbi:F-UL12 protein [Chelonid alphaherpesvirus 5]|uniref:F-UL12 protein n=1 Tax=Chelonid alphaherpesvirus 5 TaxID=702736 RepID=V5NWQ1_9ALPH|nr:F-UL12 protein [Chelonid alphaherpesvirus 5]AHA93332.1 F-UL12 protein [Chelonid alphaherpesvirus 5]
MNPFEGAETASYDSDFFPPASKRRRVQAYDPSFYTEDSSQLYGPLPETEIICFRDALLMGAPQRLEESLRNFSFPRYAAEAAASEEGLAALRDLPPRCHRLAYLYELAHRLELEGFYIGVTERLFGQSAYAPPDRCARRLMTSMSDAQAAAVFLAFERETILQRDCDLWLTLRQGLMTASAVQAFLKRAPEHQPDVLGLSKNLSFASEAAAFGCVNERCARLLLLTYVCGHPKRQFRSGQTCNDDSASSAFNEHGSGLLMDLNTGMIGASMDVFSCPRDERLCLQLPNPELGDALGIYEIKCRAKYNFSPVFSSGLMNAYEAMIADPGPKTFADFLFSIRAPGVNWFSSNGMPSAREALVTTDEAWQRGPKKVRACYIGTDLEKRLLALNRENRSLVTVFRVCAENRTVQPYRFKNGTCAFQVPVFLNPKHENAKQLLVQSYVAASYYPGRLLRAHLVTLYARERAPEESGVAFSLLGGLDPERPPASLPACLGLPVALQVTPFVFDEGCLNEIQRTAVGAWKRAVYERWDVGVAEAPRGSVTRAASPVSDGAAVTRET